MKNVILLLLFSFVIVVGHANTATCDSLPCIGAIQINIAGTNLDSFGRCQGFGSLLLNANPINLPIDSVGWTWSCNSCTVQPPFSNSLTLEFAPTYIGTRIIIATVANGLGCIYKDTITIVTSPKPQVAFVPTFVSLSCTSQTFISPNVSGPGIFPPYNYSWTGPSSFSANESPLLVTQTGNYTVTVTMPNTGCTNTASISVTSGPSMPSVSISPFSSALTCASPTAVLTANPVGGTGFTYAWGSSILVAPFGFVGSTTSAQATVNTGGTYTITVTNATGCSSTKSSTVTNNVTLPINYYVDTDGDGYGTGGANASCTPLSGYVPNNCDCNDVLASVNPMATEITTNTIDDNCNGLVNEVCANIDSASVKIIHISPTSVWLHFPPMYGSTVYNVQHRVAGATTWSSVVISVSNTIQLSGLLAGTNYQYRIRTKCGNTFTPYSSPRLFTTKTSAGTCQKPIVGAGAPYSYLSAKLHWNFSYGATKYMVRYRPSTSTSWTIVTINPVGNVLTPSINVGGLTPGATYYFQVRALCPPSDIANWTAYSNLATFTMPTAPVNCPVLFASNSLPIEGLATATLTSSLLHISPNPTEGNLYVSTDSGDGISCQVFDLMGRMIQQPHVFNNGDPIDVSSLCNGIYLLRVTLSNGQILTERFVKL